MSALFTPHAVASLRPQGARLTAFTAVIPGATCSEASRRRASERRLRPAGEPQRVRADEVSGLDVEHLVPAGRGTAHDLLPVRRQRRVPLLRRQADDREPPLGAHAPASRSSLAVRAAASSQRQAAGAPERRVAAAPCLGGVGRGPLQRLGERPHVAGRVQPAGVVGPGRVPVGGPVGDDDGHAERERQQEGAGRAAVVARDHRGVGGAEELRRPRPRRRSGAGAGSAGRRRSRRGSRRARRATGPSRRARAPRPAASSPGTPGRRGATTCGRGARRSRGRRTPPRRARARA